MDQSVLTTYQQNIALADEQVKYFQKKVNVFSLIRLIVFGTLLVLVYWAVKLNSFTIFAVGTIIIGIAFNWLVASQSRFEKQKDYFEKFKAVNQNEIDSINQYTNIYPNGDQYNNDKHFYTSDLDIFGNASLYQLLNRAATTTGRQKLANWLTAPAAKPLIIQRQEAVKELKEKAHWKLETQARLLFANNDEADGLAKLFKYLHTPVAVPGEAWLSKYIIIAPVIIIVAFAASFYIPWLKYITISIALLNFIITGTTTKATNKTDLIAGKIGNTLQNYVDAFTGIEQQNWTSAYTVQLAEVIKRPDGKSTALIMAQLSALVNKLNQRLNIYVSFFLNTIFVWNVRYVMAIEQWKREYHEDIEQAFEAIAGFEALFSIAGLQINNPHWCVPEITEGNGFTLTATDIAHPLIKQSIRVTNNYELNNTRKVDIITGSNMAGKSTFLRTLGINTVLALAGGPVCAKSMTVSVVQLFSYMRIKDSLNESTSTFKAELDRLQMLLKAVETQPNIFFLVDEMLRGTNSVDKYLGSKAVIEKLIGQQGVGLVATHDLQLAQLENDYPGYVRNFYFDIQVLNGEMLFDYKIKDGECKTFNASLLLEQIGISFRPKE